MLFLPVATKRKISASRSVKAVRAGFCLRRKTQEIARYVHRAERTVKRCLELTYEKLGAENRSHALELAVQQGLIWVEDR